jgi:OmpA-OmpF porin, OOP family
MRRFLHRAGVAGLVALAVALFAAPALADRSVESRAIWSVLFDSDRARVKRAGREVLEAIVSLWERNPDWERLIIEGHTDRSGPEASNQRLSEMRAERVRRALVELGADPDRIEVVGHGSSRPLEPGNGDRARERNRRVEFVIVR